VQQKIKGGMRLTIKLLNLEHYSESDRYVLMEGNHKPNTIYVWDSTPPHYYRYYQSLQIAGDEVLLQRDLEINGVSESEFKIFCMRMQTYREATDVSELQTAYPSVTAEQIERSLFRAIIRMRLREPNESILLSLATGVTKRQLMDEGNYSLKQIDVAITHLQNCIHYYCFSEYEKRFLYDRVNGLDKGRPEFLYTNKTFSEQFGIPITLLENVINNVITRNSELPGEEKIFIRQYMNCEEPFCSSIDEQARAHSIIEKIIHNHNEERQSFFEELVSTSQKNNTRFSLDLIPLPKEYDYEIRKACSRLGIRWQPEYKKPRCSLKKRKRLADYLDD